MTEVTSTAAICDIRFAIAVASPACASGQSVLIDSTLPRLWASESRTQIAEITKEGVSWRATEGHFGAQTSPAEEWTSKLRNCGQVAPTCVTNRTMLTAPGHIDLVRNDLSDIADGVVKMMTPAVLAGDGSPSQFCLRRCGPPVNLGHPNTSGAILPTRVRLEREIPKSMQPKRV